MYQGYVANEQQDKARWELMQARRQLRARLDAIEHKQAEQRKQLDELRAADERDGERLAFALYKNACTRTWEARR